MEFKTKLRSLRKERKITQVELAQIIGVERSSVAKYESTNTIPSNDVLINISKYFNVSIDYLLGNDEKKPVHVDELKQPSLSPEEKILLSAFAKSTDDDRRVLWALLDKYMTPNEKEYFSQSEQENNVG